MIELKDKETVGEQFKIIKIIADLQNLADNRECNLEGGKEFLSNLWEDDEEVLGDIDKIDNWEEVEERLICCDYITFKNREELEEFREDWEKE